MAVKQNEDDIYLMTTIHSRLNEADFKGEDDEDDMWVSKNRQKTLLLYFQANAGIPETGPVDPDTWRTSRRVKYLDGDRLLERLHSMKVNSKLRNRPPQLDHFLADEDYAL